jgi:ubiquitin-conjugating enzyme E2 Q
MPSSTLVADLDAATQKSIYGISDIGKGSEYGEFNFTFTSPQGQLLQFKATIPSQSSLCSLWYKLTTSQDVSEYPNDHVFLIFVTDGNPSFDVAATIEQAGISTIGMKIVELLIYMSSELRNCMATSVLDADTIMQDSSDDGNDFGLDENWNTDSMLDITREDHHSVLFSEELANLLNRRIKLDILAAKKAGFKVGVIEGMRAESPHSILSMSLHINRLGVSEDAAQAWNLKGSRYLVLLLRYSGKYKAFEEIVIDSAQSKAIQFRVGLSNAYKPSIWAAKTAFNDTNGIDIILSNPENTNNEPPKHGDCSKDARFDNLFISTSLKQFMNEQFIPLMKIRTQGNLSWDGAKEFLNNILRHNPPKHTDFDRYREPMDSPRDDLPELLTEDHMSSAGELSFPLIAMQFALRYIVRCTEFCLVCHDKMVEEFGALKPYVCARPLCLFQYMAMGCGPNIEHEILNQPYVVDLLISFCYSSARALKLREYPKGLSLSVPPVIQYAPTALLPMTSRLGSAGQITPDLQSPGAKASEVVCNVYYDEVCHLSTFANPKPTCPLRVGNWVVIDVKGTPARLRTSTSAQRANLEREIFDAASCN